MSCRSPASSWLRPCGALTWAHASAAALPSPAVYPGLGQASGERELLLIPVEQKERKPVPFRLAMLLGLAVIVGLLGATPLCFPVSFRTSVGDGES
jgi:hypothetical protein